MLCSRIGSVALQQRLQQCQGNGSGRPRACVARQGARHRRTYTCKVSAVLKQDPANQVPDPELVKMERARKALMEALLGPSLCDNNSDSDSSPPPSRPETPLEPGQVYYFSYGASMAFATLSRQGVRPLGRDPAMVADPSVRMRFRHRGGGLGLGAFARGRWRESGRGRVSSSRPCACRCCLMWRACSHAIGAAAWWRAAQAHCPSVNPFQPWHWSHAQLYRRANVAAPAFMQRLHKPAASAAAAASWL